MGGADLYSLRCPSDNESPPCSFTVILAMTLSGLRINANSKALNAARRMGHSASRNGKQRTCGIPFMGAAHHAISASLSKAAALGQKARHSSTPASRRMAPQQWPATGQALQLPRRLG